MLKFFMFFIPFAYGLFYEFTAYYAQIFLLIILGINFFKRKKIRIYLNWSTISLFIITIGYLFSCIYAIDKGMAFLGFLKFTVPLTFAIILMQYRKKHIEKIISGIPVAGITIIILSVIFKYVTFLPNYFFLPNGRIAGTFQYSNTFALFLLIGIIIALNKSEKNKKNIIYTIILLIGILATGSRLIFLITIFNFIIFSIKLKKLRKYIISLMGISILFTIIYVMITNNFNTFGRYLTTSISSSTLLGRILYYKDAIQLLIKYPFGLGYMGYAYIQSSIQTGVYSTIYIHNDILQLALDIGVIPMIVFVIAIINNLRIKKKLDIYKQILISILLHLLFDFDLQFLCIFFILIISLNILIGKRYTLKIHKGIFMTLILFTASTYSYFALCTTFHYLDKSEIAIKMYSNYTEANINVIYKSAENNIEYANKIANKIIEVNNNIALSYNIKAIYNLNKENWQSMIRYKQKSLEINKYDMNNYEEYILMLSNAINFYVQNENIDKVNECISLIVNVPSKIDELKKNTSDIAYKLKDKPKFELSEEIKSYIRTMDDIN